MRIWSMRTNKAQANVPRLAKLAAAPLVEADLCRSLGIIQAGLCFVGRVAQAGPRLEQAAERVPVPMSLRVGRSLDIAECGPACVGGWG